MKDERYDIFANNNYINKNSCKNRYRLFLGIALLGMFALATLSGLAKNKMPK